MKRLLVRCIHLHQKRRMNWALQPIRLTKSSVGQLSSVQVLLFTDCNCCIEREQRLVGRQNRRTDWCFSGRLRGDNRIVGGVPGAWTTEESVVINSVRLIVFESR